MVDHSDLNYSGLQDDIIPMYHNARKTFSWVFDSFPQSSSSGH